jgi:hypothetical protein
LIQELYLRSCLTWPGLRFELFYGLPYRNVNTLDLMQGFWESIFS